MYDKDGFVAHCDYCSCMFVNAKGPRNFLCDDCRKYRAHIDEIKELDGQIDSVTAAIRRAIALIFIAALLIFGPLVFATLFS